MPAPERLLIPTTIWRTTVDLFASYADATVEAGLFWYGVRGQDAAAVVVAGIPRQANRQRNFEISDDDLADLVRRLPEPLVVVAAVHTHPAIQTRHSDWDDQRLVSRKILSLVLPRYGRDAELDHAGVHEHDGGVWRPLSPDEASRRLALTPTVVDTRS